MGSLQFGCESRRHQNVYIAEGSLSFSENFDGREDTSVASASCHCRRTTRRKFLKAMRALFIVRVIEKQSAKAV
jgi:hypothetical protein